MKLQSIILAESVHVQRNRGIKNIIGIINSAKFDELPSSFPADYYCYYVFTGIKGKVTVDFKIIYLNTDTPVSNTQSVILYSENPHETVDGRLPISGFLIPGEGTYVFEFSLKEKILGTFRLKISKMIEEKMKYFE